MTTVHYYLGRPARVWISAHSRRSPARQSRTGSEHIRSGQPSDVAPAGGLLARQRIAIARFGTDVAAAGGIGPALAAGLDPAGYPVVPGGVPQAWERAQVYLGLYERYQELYQAQVTELHLLMATAPGCSLPLSHRRPLTDPLTDTHTGYISLTTYHSIVRVSSRPNGMGSFQYRSADRASSCMSSPQIPFDEPQALTVRYGETVGPA
jgi:hypothetical protein